MTHATVLGLTAILGVVGGAAQEPPAPAATGSEVSVRLQQLYLTVADNRGGRVKDLRPEEIEIIDGGVPQNIVTFESGEVPFTAVLLVDASLSMRGSKLATALAGACDFVAGMDEFDEAKILVFNDRIVHETPFRGPSTVKPSTFAELRAEGGSAGNDFLYLALKRLERRQGRRTVIMLSDGEDVHSTLSIGDVLFKSRHSQAIVYWLRLVSREIDEPRRAVPSGRVSAWRDAGEHRRELNGLEAVVRESGGRVISIRLEPDIGPAFQEVLRELREQVVVGYYASNPRHDQRWREVEVRFSRPGIASLARGYIDF